MAGGKETPRQKMIGMMYLVLTALLALQVSSSVMYKFKFLEEKIETVVRETSGRNINVVNNIKAKVEERGNKKQEVEILSTAKEVRSRTQEMVDYIENLREALKEIDGVNQETGFYEGAKNEDNVQTMFIGPNQNGKAYELRKKIDDYCAYLQKHATGDTKDDFKSFAVDAKDDPFFSKIADQKSKDFAELTFQNTPMVAAMAVMAEMQSTVVQMESELLNELASEVGAADFKFDVLQGMVRPESKVVAAGTKYKAEMFIAAFSSTVQPEMFYGGKEIKVENGIGLVEFTATPGKYDKEGQAKKTWKGEIKLAKPTGGDTVIVVETDYIVAKPVIQIQSASVQALYRNCGNELNVQVPALGQTYNPKFSVKGGAAIPSSKKGIVTVIPTSKNVTLTVSSNGNAIGSQSFKVRSVPLPTLVAKVGRRPANVRDGEQAPGPRAMEIDVQADKDFASFLPKDARYRATEVIVKLARGKRAVAQQTFRTSKLNLSSFAAQARPGDRYSIEVKTVMRRNFRNQNEEVDVPVTSRYIIIPII
ncbi:MAG: gliding motility protein GldM [Cytophagales bacterium]